MYNRCTIDTRVRLLQVRTPYPKADPETLAREEEEEAAEEAALQVGSMGCCVRLSCVLLTYGNADHG